MLVLVRVGTEVHAGGDSGEWLAFLQTQPALGSGGFGQALAERTRGGVRGRGLRIVLVNKVQL